MEKREFELEKEKAQSVISELHHVYEDVELMINSLKRRNVMDPIVYNNLLNQYENKLKVLENGFQKPYFARIDFTSDDEHRKEVCYIGKVGVVDSDGNIITVDWRAPIASLYYDSNIGPASYEAPKGTISGTMELKRQYEIENGELLSYRDVDTVSNDEILKPYLGVNADNRLKNIVSSIQNEQNTIIREPITNNTICQGVAGSGKTTVALHRIAYLAYNFRETIKSDQYMVIGPNKFFINYISSVLPELDVTSVPQLTYPEFAQEFIGEEISIDDIGYNPDVINGVNPYHFKMSMDFKELIDKYVKYLDEYEVVPGKDFTIKNIKILPKEAILKTYQEIQDKIYDNIEMKIERCVLLLSNYIKNNSSKLVSSVNQQYQEKMDAGNITKEKYQKEYQALKKEIESGCVASLRKHFSIKSKKTSAIYNNFLTKLSQFADREVNDSLKKITIPIKRGITFEDLPGIIYLHTLLHGAQEYKKFRHAVIDEAQDYGVFNFYALKKALPSCTFSIFGDLAQSIYDYRSIDNWEEVEKACFNNKCNVDYLLKSYRTTIEIMEQANQILDYLNMKVSEPVIRHGEDVRYTLYNPNDIQLLKNKIEGLIAQNFSSIAVISRTEEEANQIAVKLQQLGVNISYINMNNSVYEGGICSISSQCSKGLEFDAVIIANVSEKTYSSDNNTDLKNLYVSMTRALHDLEILYQEPITKPLARSLYRK